MLNPNAKLWVEALRSGKYEQTRSLLNDGEGYCCMGVACVLAAEHGVKVRITAGYDGIAYGGKSDLPPRQVWRWLGLTSEYGETGGVKNLVEHNDAGATFSEIADIIESEPEGLFKAEAGQ